MPSSHPALCLALLKHSLFSFAALLVGLATTVNAQEKKIEIGKAVAIIKKVEIVRDRSRQKIAKGSPIKQLETLETGQDASGEFVLKDQTKLAVGPNSKLLLNKFVYDADPNSRQVVITNLKGAFRFVTGKSPSKTYKIITPTAVLAVRGTMFDIYVDDAGKTTVALLKGKVNICASRTLKCLLLEKPGRFLSVDLLGKLLRKSSSDLKLLGKVPFAQAFPFIGGKYRLQHGLAAPLKLQKAMLKNIGVPILPNILPKKGKILPDLPSLDILNGKKRKRKNAKNRKSKSSTGLGIKLPKFSGVDIFSGKKKTRRTKSRKKKRRQKRRTNTR